LLLLGEKQTADATKARKVRILRCISEDTASAHF